MHLPWNKRGITQNMSNAIRFNIGNAGLILNLRYHLIKITDAERKEKYSCRQ